MTRALLITNPAAARTDVRALQVVRATLRAGGWAVEVRATARPGDARRFAQEAAAQPFDVVIAYGGDGTAMQVAAGLAGTGVPLGIVPGGTGNLLAGNLRLPYGPAAAARAILQGRPRTLDLGAVDRDDGPHCFAVCGGAGFDARLMADTSGALKRRWKMGAYLLRALTALPSVHSVAHRVTVDGTPHDRLAAMVLVANCGELVPPFLRMRADIAPDDGWLDVMVLEAEGALGSVLAFWELLRGGNGALPRRLWFGRGRTIRVETVDGAPRPVQLDGEVTGVTPFEARLRPGALTVLVDGGRRPRGDRHG